MENSKVELSKQDYMVMGLGAATSGYAVKKTIDYRTCKFANETFNAFSKGGAELDSFVAKNSAKVQKMASSKKGFFGKINRVLAGIPEGASVSDKVKEATRVVEGYKVKAAKLLGESASKEDISSLANRIQKNDIAKSIKSASALKNAVKVVTAGALGVILFSVIKEVALKLKTNKFLRKTEAEINSSEEKQNSQKEIVKPEAELQEPSSSKAKVPTAKAKRIVKA